MTRPGRSSLPNKVNGASTSVLSWFRNVRRDWNEYRLGADLDFFGVKLTLSTSGISTKMAHLHGRAEYDTPALGSERANELRDRPREFRSQRARRTADQRNALTTFQTVVAGNGRRPRPRWARESLGSRPFLPKTVIWPAPCAQATPVTKPCG